MKLTISDLEQTDDVKLEHLAKGQKVADVVDLTDCE